MSDTSGFLGRLGPFDAQDDFGLFCFMFSQLVGKLCTAELVKVIAVRGAGGPDNGPPSVDVQPMVHQIDGQYQIVPHGTIYNLPSFRLQGGGKAVIIDPVKGDVGLCIFAARDISTVKETGDFAAPGSARRFNWSDGLYLGAFLGSAPTSYLWLSDSGIVARDPTMITLDTPQVEGTGDWHTTGTITGDTDVIAAGKSGKSHVHSGVQSGGSSTNPPT